MSAAARIPATLAELVMPIGELRPYGRNPRRGDLGRRCLALELEPGYCDVIVDRWQRHTGGTAERERRTKRAV
jgi:hypothetical protein